MRIVASEFTSLDGIVQAPGAPDEDTSGGFRHGGWSHPYFDPEIMGSAITALTDRCEALLQGRRTYQVSAGAWPERAGDPFADWINAAPKYVVSDTLTDADITWNPTTIVRSADLTATVSRLRDTPGGDVYIYGSLTLVRALLAADLLDELLLFIEPVLLGGGKTLFPTDGTLRSLALVSAQTTTTGVQVCRYEPLRAG